MNILWVLVTCPTPHEAVDIGKKVLAKRYAACFDVVPRFASYYFWPPKAKKIEKAEGAILIFLTFPKYTERIRKFVRNIHSDRLPFIGTLTIKDMRKDFIQWMKDELVA